MNRKNVCSLLVLFVLVGATVLSACEGEPTEVEATPGVEQVETVVEEETVAEEETVVEEETAAEEETVVEEETVGEEETAVEEETVVETAPEAPGEVTVEPPIKEAEQLVVLDEATIQLMELPGEESITAEALDARGGVISFPGATRDMVPLEEDDVLATGITARTPMGLLRTVTDVLVTDTGVDVVTEQATLEDALEEGEFTHRAELSLPPEAAGVYTKAGGLMKVMPAPNQGEFYITLNHVLLDLDNDDKTTNDQLVVSGSIKISPKYEFNVKISAFSVKRLRFINRTTIESDVNVKAKVDFRDVHPKKVIYDPYLEPYEFFVGALPVVVTPRIVVTVGLDGNVSVEVSAGVTDEATLKIGADYENGQWRTLRGITNTLTYNPPQIKRTAKARVYVRPRIELKLYGVVVPYAQIDGYFELTVDPLKTPWQELYAGVDVEVGVEFRLFKFLKVGYRARFPLYWDPIGVLYGGRVLLMDKNDCSGDTEVEISDEAEQRMNIQSTDFWSNDEARSAKLAGVRAGILIRVYDSPGGDKGDDWIEIEVKNPTQDYCVRTFEQTYEDHFVKVTYHRHNGLDGKVSRVELDLP